MSDNGVPTAEDIEFAATYLVDDNKKYSCVKTAHEVARHRRIIEEMQTAWNRVDRAVYGDKENDGFGLLEMTKEMWKNERKNAETDRINQQKPAPVAIKARVEEHDEEKVFIISLKAVLKFLKWFIATLIAIASIAVGIWGYLS